MYILVLPPSRSEREWYQHSVGLFPVTVPMVARDIYHHQLILLAFKLNKNGVGFPGGAVVENLPANAGDTGSSPGLGRSHMPRSN